MKNNTGKRLSSGITIFTLVPPFLLALALIMTTNNVHANIAKTHTSCMPHDQPLSYTCKVNLSFQSKPVSNAEMSVSAEMPSMPMAHNMRQIIAMPVADLVGQYEFFLVLEMVGDWRLIYNISSPFIDRLHEPLIIGISEKPKEHKSSHGHTMADHSSVDTTDHN